MTLVASPRSLTLARGLREWPREGRRAGEGSRVRADQWRVCGSKEQARRPSRHRGPGLWSKIEDRRRRFGGIVFASERVLGFVSDLADWFFINAGDLVFSVIEFCLRCNVSKTKGRDGSKYKSWDEGSVHFP
ncbi:hypothetical protein NL676_030461 [Syzygium grande]|nr:hypothetical protein NL676_030461 [Syzygium grande]